MSIYNKFKLNLLPIFSLTLKFLGSIFSIIAIALSFVNWSDIGITSIMKRLLILGGICVFSFLCSTFLVLLILKRKKIWTKGKNSVYALYGDLLQIAFKTKEKERKIIVIPVNDSFETIVESTSEKITKPLVSPNTIHGMWVRRMCKSMDISCDELSSKIIENLELQNQKPLKVYQRQEKQRGNLNSYKLGTIATIDGPNNITFFLLAISKFNSENNAKATKREIRESIEDLLEYYDMKGQSNPMFIPLVGTGSSRAHLTHSQSLRIIKSCILDSEKRINGKVNVVVFNKDRDKVSIFK